MRSLFTNVRVLSGDRLLFNIRGNHYRLVVRVSYDFHTVQVRFIGTHAEYNQINARRI